MSNRGTIQVDDNVMHGKYREVGGWRRVVVGSLWGSMKWPRTSSRLLQSTDDECDDLKLRNTKKIMAMLKIARSPKILTSVVIFLLNCCCTACSIYLPALNLLNVFVQYQNYQYFIILEQYNPATSYTVMPESNVSGKAAMPQK